jgi:hypothetical protein
MVAFIEIRPCEAARIRGAHARLLQSRYIAQQFTSELTRVLVPLKTLGFVDFARVKTGKSWTSGPGDGNQMATIESLLLLAGFCGNWARAR